MNQKTLIIESLLKGPKTREQLRGDIKAERVGDFAKSLKDLIEKEKIVVEENREKKLPKRGPGRPVTGSRRGKRPGPAPKYLVIPRNIQTLDRIAQRYIESFYTLAKSAYYRGMAPELVDRLKDLKLDFEKEGKSSFNPLTSLDSTIPRKKLYTGLFTSPSLLGFVLNIIDMSRFSEISTVSEIFKSDISNIVDAFVLTDYLVGKHVIMDIAFTRLKGAEKGLTAKEIMEEFIKSLDKGFAKYEKISIEEAADIEKSPEEKIMQLIKE